MDHLFPYPKMGHSFLEILRDPLARSLLGHDADDQETQTPEQYVASVQQRLSHINQDATKHLAFLKIGYSALEAFLQSNCTGPPLDFGTREVVLPPHAISRAAEFQQEFFKVLQIDGNAVYSLTPHVELFWLAKVCMSNAKIAEAGFNGRRARFRSTFVHQKLLLERSESLREQIYNDANVLEHQLASRLAFHGAAAEEHFVEFLVERAAVRTYYGDDALAREDLVRAAKTRKFQFALTGVLGKRTKFQDRDISQLVVLAKSRDHEPEPYSSRKSSRVEGMESRKSSRAEQGTGSAMPSLQMSSPVPKSPMPKSPAHAPHKPENVPLNDDTLLEAIHFKQHPASEADLSEVADPTELHPRLSSLDPAHQPLLFPVDSIILLATASSISNTSPSDGLTREETLPYATRVLDGGSSNWQVYTQALLVRSRIEGYRSRTAERGLLQLQALVDQVIAETSTSTTPSMHETSSISDSNTLATFLPKPKPSESASVAERLRYIYQLVPPLRWELESELAARWVSMGGLKTALDIYERLQMHAEIALCLAATDQEAEAIARVRKLLFEPDESDGSPSKTAPRERQPPPPDAPRLYCILGDMTADPDCYEKAWTISNSRYARAQRSLGRHFAKQREYPAAAEAYKKALGVSRLDIGTWFALGAVQLEQEDWAGAVESFGRAVREESGADGDAEAWSNLAVALLKMPDEETVGNGVGPDLDDEEVDMLNIADEEAEREGIAPHTVQEETSPRPKTTNTHRALTALKRAAQLKRNNARIWDNYLTVAASIPPPDTPWADIILAQKQVIELRGKTIGEKAVDQRILEVFVDFVTRGWEYPKTDDNDDNDDDDDDDDDATNSTMERGSIPRQLVALVENSVVPLITASPTLWKLVAKLALWRRRPLAALEAHEKAWRVVTAQPGVYDSAKGWEGVVDATETLVAAYESLGPMERERTGGRVVEGENGWRFKARSAVRGVLGKGKASWEDSPGYERLQGLLDGLKS